jgi:hypothetical protein
MYFCFSFYGRFFHIAATLNEFFETGNPGLGLAFR